MIFMYIEDTNTCSSIILSLFSIILYYSQNSVLFTNFSFVRSYCLLIISCINIKQIILYALHFSQSGHYILTTHYNENNMIISKGLLVTSTSTTGLVITFLVIIVIREVILLSPLIVGVIFPREYSSLSSLS